MHFASSKSFFSSDQLPLTGVDDSDTTMGCNPQQTEIRKTWWLIYWLLQEQTLPWPFLACSCYGALTYCCSPAKSKTVHVPEVDLGLRCTNIYAARDSRSPPCWPGEGDSPAGHLAAWQDTLRLAWESHPARLRQALDNGWNHGRAPQPHRGKASIQVKPIKTSPAINNLQLSVQENQLLHCLKCSTCTYMKILKGSFKKYTEKRGGAGEAERCPEKEPTAVFCLIAFASCLS